MQRPPFHSLLCVLLASFAVSGCATTPHFDRNFGRSVGLLRAQQVINPQAGLEPRPGDRPRWQGGGGGLQRVPEVVHRAGAAIGRP